MGEIGEENCSEWAGTPLSLDNAIQRLKIKRERRRKRIPGLLHNHHADFAGEIRGEKKKEERKEENAIEEVRRLLFVACAESIDYAKDRKSWEGASPFLNSAQLQACSLATFPLNSTDGIKRLKPRRGGER